MENEHIISLLVGIASTGLAIIAFISTSLRLSGIMILIGLIIVLFFTLKMQQLHRETRKIVMTCAESEKRIDKIVNRFDIHKKIYKLENEIKSMKKRGAIDPLWGVAAMAIIILIIFILMAVGVL